MGCQTLFCCFLLFIRVFPVIAIAEVKSVLKSSGEKNTNKDKIEVKPRVQIAGHGVWKAWEQNWETIPDAQE